MLLSYERLNMCEDKEEFGQWPSFDNIHRVLFDKNKYNIAKSKKLDPDFLPHPIDEVFNHNVNFTVKIDGSNLGIHIKKTLTIIGILRS